MLLCFGSVSRDFVALAQGNSVHRFGSALGFFIMRLSSIVLILALTCVPAYGEDQVKNLRGESKASPSNLPEAVDSKSTEAKTPEGEPETPVAKEVETNKPESPASKEDETADPIGVPTKEVEPPQVPKHHAPEDARKVDGPAPQFGPENGEWVWVPYAAMEGPPQAWEGDFDDADDMGEAMTEADTDDMPEDARSFVAWHRGRGWGRGWGRGQWKEGDGDFLGACC